MTKEQAIKVLNTYYRGEDNDDREFCDAIEMAIKALEQPTCDDCVSRQAVIEYIKACGAELGHDIENEIVREDILNMPPVTPTRCIATVRFSKEDLREICNERIEIECTHGTCKDCKYCEDIGVKGTFYCKRYGINHLDGYYCADYEKRGSENE